MATKKNPPPSKVNRPKKPRTSIPNPRGPKPTGQPCKLTDKLQKEICETLRMGSYVETAVAHAGVGKDVHYRWMKRGAIEVRRRESHTQELATEAEIDAQRHNKLHKSVVNKRAARDKEHTDKCLAEQRFVDYREAIEKAMAEGELGALSVIARVARGGMVLSRTTTTDASGSTHVTEKLSRPEWTSAAWMLERRHPRRYGRLIRTEVSGPEQGPVALTWADAVKHAFSEEDSPDDDFEGA